MNALVLANHLQKIMADHDQRPLGPNMRFRKWDNKTPYGIHPTWCALTLLHETKLAEDVRYKGALVLLHHDILEDTNAFLPKGLADETVKLIEDMTFESSDEEMRLVWHKSPLVRLLKLYDKVSNLLDGIWMDAAKREKYVIYTKKLIKDVEIHYGILNITKIARAIAE